MGEDFRRIFLKVPETWIFIFCQPLILPCALIYSTDCKVLVSFFRLLADYENNYLGMLPIQ